MGKGCEIAGLGHSNVIMQLQLIIRQISVLVLASRGPSRPFCILLELHIESGLCFVFALLRKSQLSRYGWSPTV